MIPYQIDIEVLAESAPHGTPGIKMLIPRYHGHLDQHNAH